MLTSAEWTDVMGIEFATKMPKHHGLIRLTTFLQGPSH